MLKLVRASVLYSLLVSIPFSDIDTIARSELYPLGSKVHSHTDRDILHDQNTILLPALQSKNDIALDIHNSRCIVYTPKDTPKYGYNKGDPMILHFKEHTHIHTEKQHFDIKQVSMIVQEKEPLSPQRGFKVTAKWLSEKPSKQEKIVVGHGLTTIFSLYAVYRPDGLPLGSNSHQSVKFCYRNCYIKFDVAICVAVTAK